MFIMCPSVFGSARVDCHSSSTNSLVDEIIIMKSKCERSLKTPPIPLTSTPIGIEEESDEDYAMNEAHYKNATWRMYHRIQSYRKTSSCYKEARALQDSSSTYTSSSRDSARDELVAPRNIQGHVKGIGNDPNQTRAKGNLSTSSSFAVFDLEM